eukprot:TRINITY_DN40995_c0_g1_i4.p1 TRINITY_DN40995_c0_g1~~TRINITY_DN40995_c0_g1_i4.p1  ORF type:complete len:140 (-),score=25.45 TRINITY_DN40995_c0_g1_i4:10-381(-)
MDLVTSSAIEMEEVETPKDFVETEETGGVDPDDLVLRKMGYKQELLRGFSGFMSFSFCFTAVSCISSISIGYSYGAATGGWAVMVWGWVIGSFFTIIVGLCMAEIGRAVQQECRDRSRMPSSA